MARYSIEDTTLTSIGDAIRGKTSETKMETILVEEVVPVTETVKSPNPYPTSTSGYYQTFTMNGSSKIEVNLKCYPPAGQSLYVAEGIANNSEEFNSLTNIKTYTGDYSGSNKTDKFVMNGDSITFKIVNITSVSSNYFFTAECTALDANGNSIGGTTVWVEKEVEVKNTMTPAEMAEAINNLAEALPEEAFNITGECDYKFTQGAWNWFLDSYKDRITTNNITSAQYMFDWNKSIETVPFDIHMTTDKSSTPNISYMFRYCEGLKEVPKITGLVRNTKSLFEECVSLLELKDESVAGIDWSLVDGLTSSSGGERDSTFKSCESLRKFPMSFLAHGNPQATYSTCIYRNTFQYCYVLDEVVGLPNPHHKAAWTSNAFNSTVQNCGRLKRFTFETQEDGTPYTVNWKKQTLNFDTAGFASYAFYITNNSDIHGITANKQVFDDTTYQALKDDADWWTTKADYSRYNKTSAVETINSLPICPSDAGNIIKFKGAAGALTDGGAINTMTEEEIAVATAKGWTVSFA